MCTCIDQWAAHQRSQGLSIHTVRARTGAVQRAAATTGVDACKITTEEMIGYLDRRLAAWSRASYAASLRAWGRWLVKTGRRTDDPADGLPRPRCPKGIPRPMPEDELERLLDVVTGRERAMIVLAAYEGLRRHEVAKVRGEDVDEQMLFVEGKGGVRAMLPTHPRVWAIAQQMPPVGWWFPSRTGGGVEHLSAHAVGQIMTRAMGSECVRRTPHALRHRYGTGVLRSSGGNLRIAQELLRHASPATTAIYTLVDQDEKRCSVVITRPRQRGKALAGQRGHLLGVTMRNIARTLAIAATLAVLGASFAGTAQAGVDGKNDHPTLSSDAWTPRPGIDW